MRWGCSFQPVWLWLAWLDQELRFLRVRQPLREKGRGSGRGKGRGWKATFKTWSTNEDEHYEDYVEDPQDYDYASWETAEHYGQETDYHDVIEGEQVQEDGINDVIYENEEEANEGLEEQHGEEQIEEVYTATSKQMANQKAARGYYDTSGKGKSKSSKGGKVAVRTPSTAVPIRPRARIPTTKARARVVVMTKEKDKMEAARHRDRLGLLTLSVWAVAPPSISYVIARMWRPTRPILLQLWLRDLCLRLASFRAGWFPVVVEAVMGWEKDPGHGMTHQQFQQLHEQPHRMISMLNKLKKKKIQRKMIQWMTTLVQLDPMLISCPMCSRRLTSLRRTSSIRTCCMTWASGGSSGTLTGRCNLRRVSVHQMNLMDIGCARLTWLVGGLTEMVVNLQRPSDDWLSSTFNIFAAIDDDEEGLQRQRDAINRFQDDSWKGGWYTWEINGMSVVCCWNWHPERYVPLPLGLTRSQVCRYRSTWLVKRDGDLRWVHHEWNRSTTTIGWADDENFRGTFDTTTYKAAIHFFTTESLGPFTVPHLRDQFSYMINFALYSKKKFLQSLIYYGETARTVNRGNPRPDPADSGDEPEGEEVAYMVSEGSLPMYRQPELTNFLSNADEPCCMILDTGCQRQVAGKEWHRAHQKHLLNIQRRQAFVLDLNQQRSPKCDGLIHVALPVTFVCCGFQKWMHQHQHFAVDTPCQSWELWLMLQEVKCFSEVSIQPVSCISLHVVTLLFGLMSFQQPCRHGLWPHRWTVSIHLTVGLQNFRLLAVALCIVQFTAPKFRWPPMPAPPQWLRRWRALLIHLNMFIDQVTMMARLYSSTSMRANLRGCSPAMQLGWWRRRWEPTSTRRIQRRAIIREAFGTTEQEECQWRSATCAGSEGWWCPTTHHKPEGW